MLATDRVERARRLEQPGRPTGRRRLAGQPSQPGARCVGLPAPALAARAERAVRVDHHVTRLAGEAVGAPQQLPVEDDAAADARAEGDGDQALAAAADDPVRRDGGAVGVVVDQRRQVEAQTELPRHVHTHQTRGVGRPTDDAASVDEPGQTDADRCGNRRVTLHQGVDGLHDHRQGLVGVRERREQLPVQHVRSTAVERELDEHRQGLGPPDVHTDVAGRGQRHGVAVDHIRAALGHWPGTGAGVRCQRPVDQSSTLRARSPMPPTAAADASSSARTMTWTRSDMRSRRRSTASMAAAGRRAGPRRAVAVTRRTTPCADASRRSMTAHSIDSGSPVGEQNTGERRCRVTRRRGCRRRLGWHDRRIRCRDPGQEVPLLVAQLQLPDPQVGQLRGGRLVGADRAPGHPRGGPGHRPAPPRPRPTDRSARRRALHPGRRPGVRARPPRPRWRCARHAPRRANGATGRPASTGPGESSRGCGGIGGSSTGPAGSSKLIEDTEAATSLSASPSSFSASRVDSGSAAVRWRSNAAAPRTCSAASPPIATLWASSSALRPSGGSPRSRSDSANSRCSWAAPSSSPERSATRVRSTATSASSSSARWRAALTCAERSRSARTEGMPMT